MRFDKVDMINFPKLSNLLSSPLYQTSLYFIGDIYVFLNGLLYNSSCKNAACSWHLYSKPNKNKYEDYVL